MTQSIVLKHSSIHIMRYLDPGTILLHTECIQFTTFQNTFSTSNGSLVTFVVALPPSRKKIGSLSRIRKGSLHLAPRPNKSSELTEATFCFINYNEGKSPLIRLISRITH